MHAITKKITLLMTFMICCGLGVAVANISNPSEPPNFIEGKHFQKVSEDVIENDLVQELQNDANQKIQVLEFFSYGCSWCYKLDAPVEEWVQKKSDSIEFQRVPVEFQPSWRTLSKAYYVAVDLDELNRIHQPLFKAIHTDEITSSSEEVLRSFFEKQGIDGEAFDKSFGSFSVNRKHKWANAISQAFRVTAVPSIFVQGPKGVYFTSVRMAGSQEKFLEVLDFLIVKNQENTSLEKTNKELNRQGV